MMSVSWNAGFIMQRQYTTRNTALAYRPILCTVHARLCRDGQCKAIGRFPQSSDVSHRPWLRELVLKDDFLVLVDPWP